MGVSLTQILADKSNVPLGKNATPIKEKGLVYVAEGLPPLPAKIVEIIEKGEFIDFVELLPKHPILEDQSVTELSENIVVISHSRQLTKKKVIKDIETWMEAFCTFAAVRAKKYQLTIPDLLAYGATIVKGARDYGGQQWLAYDYRFRQLAAARQLESGWGHKDMALWNDTFLHPKKEKSKEQIDTCPARDDQQTTYKLSRRKGKRKIGPGRAKSATPLAIMEGKMRIPSCLLRLWGRSSSAILSQKDNTAIVYSYPTPPFLLKCELYTH